MSNAFTTYVVGPLALALMALAAPTTATSRATATPRAAAATPQAKPDFSGVWSLVAPATPPSGASSGGAAALPPAPITIRHTAKSIAIERTAFGNVTTMTFTIDGAQDDRNRTGAQSWLTRTRWDGKTLVTTGKIAQNTSLGFDEWTYTESRSLDARGHMIVETKHVDLNDGKVTTSKQDWARSGSPGPLNQP